MKNLVTATLRIKNHDDNQHTKTSSSSKYPTIKILEGEKTEGEKKDYSNDELRQKLLNINNSINSLNLIKFMLDANIFTFDGTVEFKKNTGKPYIKWNAIPQLEQKVYQIPEIDKEVYIKVGTEYVIETKEKRSRFLKAPYPHKFEVKDGKIVLKIRENDWGNLITVKEIDITNDFKDLKIDKDKNFSSNIIYAKYSPTNELNLGVKDIFYQGQITVPEVTPEGVKQSWRDIKQKVIYGQYDIRFISYDTDDEETGVKKSSTEKYKRNELHKNEGLKRKYNRKISEFKRYAEQIINKLLKEKNIEKNAVLEEMKKRGLIKEKEAKIAKEKVQTSEINTTNIDMENLPF